MTAKKIEDDSKVLEMTLALMHGIPAGATPAQYMEALFSAMCTIAAMGGWSQDALVEWAEGSIRTTYENIDDTTKAIIKQVAERRRSAAQ